MPLQTPATGFPGFLQTRRSPRVITGDVWAFLRHAVEVREVRLGRERTRQALAYLEQAYDFHAAAANPQVGSRPLLYYYSFMNLAKAYLLQSGENVPPLARHGISDPRANVRERLRLEGQRIRIAQPAPGQYEIFREFVRVLGGANPTRWDFRIVGLLAQVPAIHRAYTQTFRKAPCFLPVRRFDLLTDGRQVWARLVFIRDDPDVRQTLGKASRLRAFRQSLTQVKPEDDTGDGETWLETNAVPGRRRGVDPALRRLAGDLRKVGLWAVLTGRGYRYYLATFEPSERLPQLAAVYAVMFYLGSITRYKPYDFDRIIAGRYAWVVNEFLASQPQQFHYLLASTVAGVDVVRPWAVM